MARHSANDDILPYERLSAEQNEIRLLEIQPVTDDHEPIIICKAKMALMGWLLYSLSMSKLISQ